MELLSCALSHMLAVEDMFMFDAQTRSAMTLRSSSFSS